MNGNGGSTASRVHDIVRMNAPEFFGSHTSDDPQYFIHDNKKILELMLVTRNDQVELVSYQVKDVAHILYTH